MLPLALRPEGVLRYPVRPEGKDLPEAGEFPRPVQVPVPRRVPEVLFRIAKIADGVRVGVKHVEIVHVRSLPEVRH